MSENRLIGRIVNKHDIQANWEKATNFTPMLGEIIVYDVDENFAYERFKIGDGQQNVNTLPFADAAAVAEAKAYTDAELSAALISSQADWNENDSTSPAYVKNRTHWAESQLTEVFPETTITTTVNTYIPMENPIQMSQDLVSGKEYIVEFDGERYECVANSDYGQAGAYWVYIGNGKLIDPTDIVQLQDCPFVVGLFMNGETYFTAETAGDHTIAVYCYGEETVHQLDPKYIPSDIARVSQLDGLATEDHVTTLIGETSVSEQITSALEGYVKLDPNDTAIEGEAALVNAGTFNGMTYDAVKTDIVSEAQSNDTAFGRYYQENKLSQIGAVGTCVTWDVAEDDMKPYLTKSGGANGTEYVNFYTDNNPPPYPVTSVNGATGVVTLAASDVGALPTSGGALTGALTFANGTWNPVGDDTYIGDHNVAGSFCIKPANSANSAIVLYNNDETIANTLTFDGANPTWNGNYIYHQGNKPSYADIGAAAASHTHYSVTNSGNELSVAVDTTNPYLILSSQGLPKLAIQKISGNANTAALHWYNETDGSWLNAGNIWSSANLGFGLSGTTLTITTY